MNDMNLAPNVRMVRVSNAVAAGTTLVTCTAIDTQGYGGLMIVAAYGALTATQQTRLSAEHSDVVGSGYTDIEGANLPLMLDADGNKCQILEIIRPKRRFIRPLIRRGTANAVIDGVFATLFNPTSRPTAVDATFVGTASRKVLVSPNSGTP